MRSIGRLLAPWWKETEGKEETSVAHGAAQTTYYSTTQLLVTVLIFRLGYLCAMGLSCYLIPEHNPGDGVMRFDMRLTEEEDSNHPTNCFCWKGHACDAGTNSIEDDDANPCAIPSVSDSFLPPRVWKFFLEPLTKWDAARFLTLAVNPSLRNPTTADAASSWEESEQAHAFLPLFPTAMRHVALGLYRILPPQVLPPTFESLVVLAGMIFNNVICLTLAILALYRLTVLVLGGNPAAPPHPATDHPHAVAIAVCLVFGIWNPALVFFATNYSESFFCAATLWGHLFLLKSKLSQNGGIRNLLWWYAGIACWMVGSYTRSNGTLQCLWLLQDGLARILLLVRQHGTSNSINGSWTKTSLVGRAMAIGIQTIVGALLVAFPVRYHDAQGWERHCLGSAVAGAPRPSWCSYHQDEASSFSLYRHVQDKHWNVGLFRYYEWKQIPNFLLAAPILVLSIVGVHRWIHWALIDVYGKGKLPSSYQSLFVGWPIYALSESVSVSRSTGTSPPPPSTQCSTSLLLENPLLLGHYAILAILTVLGLVLAHVQISTRMICSTSPAIMWIMVQHLLAVSSSSNDVPNSTEEKEPTTKGMISFLARNRSQIVWCYVGLYMFLGVILHVNFLPWT